MGGSNNASPLKLFNLHAIIYGIYINVFTVTHSIMLSNHEFAFGGGAQTISVSFREVQIE